MSDNTKKILLLDYHSETTEQTMNLLQWFDVKTAQSLEEVAEKGKDDFDLVITGYVVPSISDDTLFSYLKDVDAAIKKLESEIRKDKTEEVIETEFREKQDQILQRLNIVIEAREKEKAENEATLKKMEQVRTETLIFKEQAEQQLRQAKERIYEAEKQVEEAEKRVKESQIIADEAKKSEQISAMTTEVALKEKQEAEDAKKEAELKAELALEEKIEAEKIAEAALLEKEKADEKIASALAEKTAIINRLTANISKLNQQLEAAQENVQRVQMEHKKTQTKLERLQETWENYKNS